jgi:hypothetical protein
VKKFLFTLFVTLLTSLSVMAGTIAEEHEKAKKGDYEADYEKQMKKTEGWRTRQEHEKYHREQEQKSNKTDKEEDYGKTYQEKQLGTEKKIRTW